VRSRRIKYRIEAKIALVRGSVILTDILSPQFFSDDLRGLHSEGYSADNVFRINFID
jgi:hypothetical protein